jgi:hypothetical protein
MKIALNKIINIVFKLLKLFFIHFAFGPMDIKNKKATTIGIITVL